MILATTLYAVVTTHYAVLASPPNDIFPEWFCHHHFLWLSTQWMCLLLIDWLL